MQPRLRGGTDEHKQIKDRNDLEPNAHSATLSRHKGTRHSTKDWARVEVRVSSLQSRKGGVWLGKQEGKGTSANEEDKDTGKEEAKVPKWRGAAKVKYCAGPLKSHKEKLLVKVLNQNLGTFLVRDLELHIILAIKNWRTPGGLETIDTTVQKLLQEEDLMINPFM